MLSWKKLGNVFNPTLTKPRPWMQAYAQCPFPLVMNDDVLRVYITSRGQRDADGQMISYPAYIDLDRKDLSRVIGIAEKPLMSLGPPGSFDEFGMTPSSFVRQGAEIYAYYTGWTRMRSVPYTMAIGLAISRDGGDTFEKYGVGPIMAATPNEPYFVSGPIVRVVDGAWHMWYISGKKWLVAGDKRESVYQIAHAASDDGIVWRRDSRTIITPRFQDECQVSLATFRRNEKWQAVFAYRQPTDFRQDSSRAYRLGYASSDDLVAWTRDDNQVGIDVSPDGWDSQMMCYPQVIDLDGRVVLIYCGNEFGREGIGVAELTNWS